MLSPKFLCFILAILPFFASFPAQAIIGGKAVDSADPIAQVTVQLWRVHPTERKRKANCSGIVVARDIVLTAAHCLYLEMDKNDTPMKIGDLFVYVGNWDAKTGFLERDTYAISDYRVNPAFAKRGANLKQLDFALVKLSRDLPDSMPAASFLPSRESLKLNEQVVVAGYGLTKLLPKKLDTEVFLQKYESFKINKIPRGIDPVRLKTSWGKGSYLGDSGGPAFVMRGGQLKIWGVFSQFLYFPKGLGGTAWYGDVRVAKEWMNETLREYGSALLLE